MGGMCDTSIRSHSLMLSQMLLSSAAETAEHITHPAWSHPDPQQAFSHHYVSTEGNQQTVSVLGFKLWHSGRKYAAVQLLQCKGPALGLGTVRQSGVWHVCHLTLTCSVWVVPCSPLLAALPFCWILLPLEKKGQKGKWPALLPPIAVCKLISSGGLCCYCLLLTAPELVPPGKAGWVAGITVLWLDLPRLYCTK